MIIAILNSCRILSLVSIILLEVGGEGTAKSILLYIVWQLRITIFICLYVVQYVEANYIVTVIVSSPLTGVSNILKSFRIKAFYNLDKIHIVGKA